MGVWHQVGVSCVLLAFSVEAAADVPEVGWDSIRAVANARFDARSAGTRAEIAGLARAESRLTGSLRSLWVTAEPGVGVVNRESGSADSFLSIGTSFELGDRRSLEQSRLNAATAELEAGAAVGRFKFLSDAEQLWLRWVKAAVLTRHLEADVAEYDAVLSPIARALARNAISKLDWLDLQAERARLRAEVAEASRAMAVERASLESHLWMAVRPVVGANNWTSLPPEGAWSALERVIVNHPVMAERTASAARERADALATEFEPVGLDVGLLTHLDEAGFAWAAATLTVTIPLSNPGRVDAEAARGRALFQEHEREWTGVRLLAEVRARKRQHRAYRAAAERLSQDLITPLSDRFEFVKRALSEGAVDGTRLVRAWRDLHEARHLRLETLLRVATDAAQAQALTQLLTQ